MPKIMIVDDDRLTVSLLTTFLELEDFQVVSVADGKSALKRAIEEHPDAFLVDFHLSDGSGIDFIKGLRAESTFGATPIVMASGLNREDEAIEAGANHFMIKPFDPGDLIDVINDLLSEA